MREMKDSGVEWIGEIPKEWRLIRNKYAFECQKTLVGASYQSKQLLSLTTKGIKEKDIENAEGKLPESFETYQDVKANSIVMCLFDLDCSAVFSGISKFDGMISPAYSVLECKQNVIPQFADYWFSYVAEDRKFVQYSKNLRHTLSFGEFSSLLILVPQIETQHRIADYLDAKCAQIDRAIVRQQEVIEKLKEYKLSVITEAVTKGLNPDVPMKDSGIEWIGEIPEHWDSYRIAALYREVCEDGSDDLPILSVSINTGVSDRELEDEEQDRIFVRSDDKSKYKRVQIGDLTYNMMRAWQGAFGAVRVEGMVSPAYVVARPHKKEDLDSRYIEYLLRTTAAKEEMRRYSHGIADFRLRLYWAYFKSMKICFPSKLEQEAIADYIDKKSAQIDSIIARKDGLISKLSEYKKSLIYEVVTGKREV